MRRVLRSAAVAGMAGVLAVLIAPVYGQTASRSISLSRSAKIADQVLSEGKYSVSFDLSQDGEVVISRGSKEIVRANYTRVELAREAPATVVVFIAADDGSLSIRRIEIKGSKTALQIQ